MPAESATARARLVGAWREGLPPPWDWLLAGAAVGYRAGLALRAAAYATGVRRTRALPCPVIAVGNLTVGGTGKTPAVEWLARELAARGRRVAILSRGYGRRAGGGTITVVSDGARVTATAAEAGDEPLLLARRLPGVPVVVGADRFRAGAAALARFRADALLLDDGFQQRRLRVDVAVVCLDAAAPWGRRGLLPRGTLREPPAALRRADLLVLTEAPGIAADRAAAEATVRRHAPAAASVHARYEPLAPVEARSQVPVDPAVLGVTPVLAFAGIARPERFAATLAELGVRPRGLVAFPDHHRYGPGEVARLEARARAAGASARVTTEKDAVRLPDGGRLPVWVVPVALRVEPPPAAWWAALDARLAPR